MEDKKLTYQKNLVASFSKLNKSSIVWGLVVTLAYLVFSVVYILIKSYSGGTSVDFYETNRANGYNNGKRVSINIDAVLNNYASNTHTNRSIKTSVDEYYTVWLDDGDIISVSVNDKKTKEQLDALYDYTWKYLGSDTDEWNPPYIVTINGKMEGVNGELRNYYDKAIDYMGYQSGTNGNILYYNINATKAYKTILLPIIVGILMVTACSLQLYLKNKADRLAAQWKREEVIKNAMAGNEPDDSNQQVKIDDIQF